MTKSLQSEEGVGPFHTQGSSIIENSKVFLKLNSRIKEDKSLRAA